ncbi:MAG TPA: FecR domain-containing protein [Chitinophaga sp.]|uniref:FecR family protein n=1 Tax=Chitinophaga sp. TaxID=1869181 RepID=UPI002BE8EC1F|nr:FecR domain-containing protein [Chitinophaga sp.]HVI47858.1 FecR domain-containing protein [Chitinophaga sp.]
MYNRKEYLRQLLHVDKWSPEEQDWMRAYLEGDDLSDLETVAMEDYQADLQMMKEKLDKRLSARMLKNIHERLGLNNRKFAGTFTLYRRWVAAAAAVILVLGAAWYLTRQQQVKMVAVTAQSERKTVTLPDGSLVFLEKGSGITFPDNFGKTAREVDLRGEAFFEVKQNAVRPFTISSELIKTTVLGTSFNMDVHLGKAARVTVVSGMVQVNTTAVTQGSNQQLVLTANKGMVYHPGSSQMQLIDGTEDARFLTQRRNGKFVYKGTAVSQVLNDLQRYYDIPVKAPGAVGQCSFYGDFSINDELNKVLTLIAVTLNARIEKDTEGNGYTIVGGNCQ